MTSDIVLLSDLSFRSLFLSEPQLLEVTMPRLRSGNRRVRKSKRNLWEPLRRALGKKMFLGNQSSLFSHIQIPIAAYYPFYMRLNWIPYRGKRLRLMWCLFCETL